MDEYIQGLRATSRPLGRQQAESDNHKGTYCTLSSARLPTSLSSSFFTRGPAALASLFWIPFILIILTNPTRTAMLPTTNAMIETTLAPLSLAFGLEASKEEKLEVLRSSSRSC